MKRALVSWSICLVIMFLPCTSGFAKPFYEGKTIQLIVATKPGGNYDFFARMVSNVMQNYLPGSTIIVKNIPGAGHIIGANHLYHSKPDGLTFGTFNRALALSQVAGFAGIQFDMAKMSWLGSPAKDVFCLITTPKYKTLNGVFSADLVKMASAGIGTQSHVTTALFIDMMKLKNMKIVTGFVGGEAEMAMMRGELDGQFGSWASLKSFVNDGHGQPVLFIGKKQPEGFESIPLLIDIIKDDKYIPVANLLLSLNLLSRPFGGPPAIPADRFKILTDAFTKTCSDAEFMKMAQTADVPVDFTDGAEAQELIQSMLKLSPDVVQLIKKAYGTK